MKKEYKQIIALDSCKTYYLFGVVMFGRVSWKSIVC